MTTNGEPKYGAWVADHVELDDGTHDNCEYETNEQSWRRR